MDKISLNQKTYIQYNDFILMDKIVDIEQVSNLLIRPPRFTYSLADMGPNIMTINGILTRRFDFNVKNQTNQTLSCSLYYQGKIQNISVCFVYLHCNCGSRIEAKQFIEPAMNAGYSLLTFDFAGCGHSSGKYISLGYHEVFDLKVVLSYFQRITSPDVQLVLWGRSMGAVTVVRYIAQANQKMLKNVKIGVLDSPFLSLKSLILQLVSQKIGMPKFLVQIFLKYVEPVIEQKAQFKISDLDLTDMINKILCPIIFIASKQDSLVPYSHIQQLYERHKGKKTVYYLEQNHNEPRRLEIVNKVFKSIWKYILEEKNTIQVQQSEQLTMRLNTNQSNQSLGKRGRSLSKGKISLTMTQRNINCSNLKSKSKKPLKDHNIKLKSFISAEIDVKREQAKNTKFVSMFNKIKETQSTQLKRVVNKQKENKLVFK